MRRLLSCAPLVLTGCQGCIGISDGPVVLDADDDGDKTVDADAGVDDDAGPCNPLADFDTPVPIVELDTLGTELAPVLRVDEREIFYLSDQGLQKYTLAIWRASRSDVGQPFTKGQPVLELKSSDEEVAGIALAPNALTLYYTRFQHDAGSRNIAITTRPTFASPFTTPQLLAGANDPMNFPFEISIGQTSEDLYMAIQHAEFGPFSLYVSSRSDGGYGAPTQVLTGSDHRSPAITWDELTLYFARKPSGSASADTWAATRSPMSAWTQPFSINPLSNPGVGEFPSWLSKDNCRLYMSVYDSNGWDLYVARRHPK